MAALRRREYRRLQDGEIFRDWESKRIFVAQVFVRICAEISNRANQCAKAHAFQWLSTCPWGSRTAFVSRSCHKADAAAFLRQMEQNSRGRLGRFFSDIQVRAQSPTSEARTSPSGTRMGATKGTGLPFSCREPARPLPLAARGRDVRKQ